MRNEKFSFGKDGKFRIMHITDTHLAYDNRDASVALIERCCIDEKPDIIMLTGDVASSVDLKEMKSSIDMLMNVFVKLDIPVAVCPGNHDTENGNITRTEFIDYFNSFPVSVSENDVYNIPVFSSDGEKIKFNLWVFDSGDYDEEGRYANVTEDKIERYRAKSEELERENGGKINSFAFQHIIVPDVYKALKKVKRKGPYVYEGIYRKDEYYCLDPEKTRSGILLEEPCCGYHDHGQFSVFVERGDVLAVFSGHDHMSTFCVTLDNINIENTPSTRYQNDSFSTQYGYRMLTVSENDTSVYEDRVVQWYNKFTFEDIKNAKDDKTKKLMRSVVLKGKKQKFTEFIGHTACRIVTGGRKAVY